MSDFGKQIVDGRQNHDNGHITTIIRYDVRPIGMEYKKLLENAYLLLFHSLWMENWSSSICHPLNHTCYNGQKVLKMNSSLERNFHDMSLKQLLKNLIGFRFPS